MLVIYHRCRDRGSPARSRRLYPGNLSRLPFHLCRTPLHLKSRRYQSLRLQNFACHLRLNHGFLQHLPKYSSGIYYPNSRRRHWANRGAPGPRRAHACWAGRLALERSHRGGARVAGARGGGQARRCIPPALSCALLPLEGKRGSVEGRGETGVCGRRFCSRVYD